MMNDNPDWTHRWFGFWREDDDSSPDWPSVSTWPKAPLEPQVLESVSTRLTGGEEVCVTQTRARSCKLCAHKFPPSMAWLSDGLWLWPEDLSHYVEAHSLALPRTLLARLLDPTVEPMHGIDLDSLEWPGEDD